MNRIVHYYHVSVNSDGAFQKFYIISFGFFHFWMLSLLLVCAWVGWDKKRTGTSDGWLRTVYPTSYFPSRLIVRKTRSNFSLPHMHHWLVHLHASDSMAEVFYYTHIILGFTSTNYIDNSYKNSNNKLLYLAFEVLNLKETQRRDWWKYTLVHSDRQSICLFYFMNLTSFF